ncbi:MAG TPA: hypothetical protein VJM47_03100 [Nitrosospira sp.]|nr:hypothetical protein [Nitrosospira sp.]
MDFNPDNPSGREDDEPDCETVLSAGEMHNLVYESGQAAKIATN